MKQVFRKFIVGALSCLSILQACQNPNVNTLDLNKNQSSFNVKNLALCNTWQIRSFNNDDRQFVSVNGQTVFVNDLSLNQDSGLIDINQYLVNGTNTVTFTTLNECCVGVPTPHSWGYEVYKDGQVVFSDVQYNPYVPMGVTYSNSYTINITSTCPTPTPTINPTIEPTPPEPTIPPTTNDCSQKSINDFNKNVDDTVDALNKLNYLFSLVSSNSRFKAKAYYNSPMYDQGAYDFALDVQQRTAEVKAMENSAIEAERIAYNEYKFEAAKILTSAGLVIGTAGMSAVPGFLTQLAATSPEVFFLATQSPQVLAALNRASALITALKILKSGDSCLTPALASGVDNSKSALSTIDDMLNGIFKATGKTGSSGIVNWSLSTFKNPAKLTSHFKKHVLQEAGSFGPEIANEVDYLNRARSLLSSKIGGNLERHTSAQGTNFTIDKTTGQLAIGGSNGIIETLFVPRYKANDSMTDRLTKAYKYFKEQAVKYP